MYEYASTTLLSCLSLFGLWEHNPCKVFTFSAWPCPLAGHNRSLSVFEPQYFAGIEVALGTETDEPLAELGGTEMGKPSAEVACRTEPVRQTEVA